MVRKQIRFTGEVQGVGFRYVASREARNLGLTGWVKNLDDGSVLMEAQGPEMQIEMLLMHLYNARYIGIHNMEAKILPLKGGEKSFGIVYY